MKCKGRSKECLNTAWFILMGSYIHLQYLKMVLSQRNNKTVEFYINSYSRHHSFLPDYPSLIAIHALKRSPSLCFP
jgi:hypothetical protein